MTPKRLWYLDMIAAVALFAVGIIGAKALRGAVGVIPALFFFILLGGLGYYYFRVAWSVLRQGREQSSGRHTSSRKDIL
ncbi:MAG: hypothetical protein OHK0029_33300 [Armatimonadaceae bacterium]